jgi:hypothetical protein
MGSWDFTGDEGYDGPALPHAILCNSKWAGKERHDHVTLAEVRACYRAARDEAAGVQVWPCSWLLEGRYDDMSIYTFECGAPARYTDGRGSYECEAGHDHIALEVQAERGIAYTDDADEARGLMKAGVLPLTMAGAVFPL